MFSHFSFGQDINITVANENGGFEDDFTAWSTVPKYDEGRLFLINNDNPNSSLKALFYPGNTTLPHTIDAPIKNLVVNETYALTFFSAGTQATAEVYESTSEGVETVLKTFEFDNENSGTTYKFYTMLFEATKGTLRIRFTFKIDDESSYPLYIDDVNVLPVVAGGNFGFEGNDLGDPGEGDPEFGWEYDGYWSVVQDNPYERENSAYYEWSPAWSISKSKVTGLKIGKIYTFVFYAAGGEGDLYIGPLDNYKNGVYFYTWGGGDVSSYVKQQFVFTATATTMRVQFEVFRGTPLYLDDFHVFQSPDSGKLLINEVNRNPDSGASYVELYNSSDVDMILEKGDLETYIGESTSADAILNLSGILGSQQYLIITKDKAAFDATHTIPADVEFPDLDLNSIDGLIIRHDELGVLDGFNDVPIPTGVLAPNHLYLRKGGDLENGGTNLLEHWCDVGEFNIGTPGVTNTTVFLEASATVQPTCALKEGTIVVSSPTGTNYEYSINDEDWQSEVTFANLPPNNDYTVTVRDKDVDITCSSGTVTITINVVPLAPPAPTILSITQPNCNTTSGIIIFTPQTDVEYSVGGTFQTSETFNGLAPGDYTLTVRSVTDNTCTTSGETVTINTLPTLPNTPTTSETQPTCAVATGTIEVVDPIGDYEYSINGGVSYQASPIFANLDSGTYSIIVKRDADPTCLNIGNPITINSVPTPPAVPTVASEIQATCAVPTGTIVFTYQASVEYGVDDVYQPDEIFSGLAPDATYTLTVRNISDYSCISTADSTVILNPLPTPPAEPSVASTTQPTCDVPTGSIVFTTQTGVEYSVGNGFQSSETFTGLTADTTYTLTVRNTTDNTCTTNAATTVTINAIPNVPSEPTSGGDEEFCQEGTIPTLTVTVETGETANWYASATSGTPLTNGEETTSYTPDFAGTYYAETKNTSTGCVSLVRTAVVLTENLLPTITITSAATCSVDLNTYSLEVAVSSGTLTSTAGTVTNTSGNTWTIAAITTGSNITLSLTDGKGCIKTKGIIAPDCSCPTIEAPVSGGNSIECEQDPIQNLTATATPPAGATKVVWYDAESGGNVVTDPTLNTVGQIIYYAESLDEVTGCVSSTRTDVLLRIDPTPSGPASGGDITECVTDPIQTITATATAPAGAAVIWYDASTGGNIVENPILNAIGTITYYAESGNVIKNNASCNSLSRTAVTLTINPLPTAPGVSTPVIYCQGETAVKLTAIGTNLLWYTDSTGGIGNPIAPIPSTAIVGDNSYYVSQTGGKSCESERAEIVVTINSFPPPPFASVTFQPTCATPLGTLEVESPLGASLEYSLDGISYQSSPIFAELAPGEYTITARDNNDPSCESNGNTLHIRTVQTPPTIPIASNIVQPTCAIPTGTIEIAEPEEHFLIYSIDGINFQFNRKFEGLLPGDYIVIVKKLFDLSCESMGSPITINTAPNAPSHPIAYVASHPTCDIPTGNIEVTAPLGTNFEYSVDGGTVYQAETTFTNLEPGDYSILVRDLNESSCESKGNTLSINNKPEKPIIEGVNVTNPNCPLLNDGSILIIATGTNLVYSIDNGINFQISNSFTGLTTGLYTVVVRNSTSNCSVIFESEIELVAPICFAELQVDKTQIGGPNPVTKVNEVLEYEIVVQNPGTIDITGIVVTDTFPDGTTVTLLGPSSNLNQDDILDIGEAWTYLVDYTVSLEDINKGLDITNTVSVESNELTEPINDTAITQLNSSPNEFILPNEPGSTKKGFGFSPNGDGMNDVFRVHSYDGEVFIEEMYPNFKVEIFNRWGDTLYDYTHNGNPNTNQPGWDGFSHGKRTLNNGEILPVGTYFYTVYFNDGVREPYSGWVYLSK